MDATRLRSLLLAAIDAQNKLDAARDAETRARREVELATELHRKELGNLKAAHDGVIDFGDNFARVGSDQSGPRVILIPRVTVPVVAPAPAPLPEAVPDPALSRAPVAPADVPPINKPSTSAPVKQAPPTSGGVIPKQIKK